MVTKTNVLLVSLLSLTVVLAGCTSSDEGNTPATEEDGVAKLGNKGAINGLIVDDNYRPVQLQEEWGTAGPGDYQDIGFILVMETAQRFETNENGEFQVIPLDPGTYTIRVAADNHEAIDKKVQVVAGEFAEVTIEARRTFSGDGTLLSQEYVVFAGCNVRAVVIGFSNVMCGDTSGDSQRAAFTTNYKDIQHDIRGMVTEMRAHQDGWYRVQIRNTAFGGCGDFSNGCLYWLGETPDTTYLRGVTYPFLNWLPGDEYLEEGQQGYCSPEGYNDGSTTDCNVNGFMAPSFDQPFDTILFPEHPIKQYYADTEAGFLFGAGVVLGVKAQFVQNVFLYEIPDGGIDDFCTLCDDADIPE